MEDALIRLENSLLSLSPTHLRSKLAITEAEEEFHMGEEGVLGLPLNT